MRVLVLDYEIPFPVIGGGRLRTSHLLSALAGGHEVTVVGFTHDEPPGEPALPIRVVTVPFETPPLYERMMYGDTEASLDAYRTLNASPDPARVSWVESPAMEATLRDLAREPFDLAVIEQSYMGRFVSALPETLPVVIDFHDVHTLMDRRLAARARDGQDAVERERAEREATRTHRYEQRIAARAALCTTCSEEEAAIVRDELGARRAAVVPNGVDTEYFVPTAEPTRPGALLFTGMMNYPPNVEGARYFADQVLPRIRRVMSDAHLDLVGSQPAPEVSALATAESVTVHGFVPDMRPYFRDAAVVIVPLLTGGGTRLKILEAAAAGKAVVSTSLGAEGLGLRDGEEIVIADTAEQFADAVVGLLGDERRRRELGARARAAALPFDWARIESTFRELVMSVHREAPAGSKRRGGA